MTNKEKKHITELIEQINKLYNGYQSLSNDELRQLSFKLQDFVADKGEEVLDTILPQAFALVKETARRFTLGDIEVKTTKQDLLNKGKFDFLTIKEDGNSIFHNHWDVCGVGYSWKMIHYDEQLMAGIFMHKGYAIEMATGEGKTLACTLPAFLNALQHKGVHIQTTNDYLSIRDFETTRPIYIFLGLSADCIECQQEMTFGRRNAYLADITFGSNISFVFDYLCDHLALHKSQVVQRHHHFTIIDEIDAILIDEANTLHIVASDNRRIFYKYISEYNKYMKEMMQLQDKKYYTVNPSKQIINLTKSGEKWLEEKTGVCNLFSVSKKDLLATSDKKEKEKTTNLLTKQHAILQLLVAYTLHKKNVDYTVVAGSIILIDPNTGRLKDTHFYENGLHNAIEVKEGLENNGEPDASAVISLKNFLRLYDKVTGMSGTILTSRKEFKSTYNLRVEKIPTHKPCIRIDNPLRVYKNEQAKYQHIIKTIHSISLSGRPVLVGCLSTLEAEHLSNILEKKGIKHNLLDALNLKDEAKIIAKAGIAGTITVSTNIVGRGTDIKLSQESINNGGLCVICVGLQDSLRLDLQLKGRAGRQGEPGSSYIFSSLDEDILNFLDKREKQELIEATQHRANTSKARQFFIKAQQNAESFFSKVRKDIALKDDTIAPYRKMLYAKRNSLLFGGEKDNVERLVNTQCDNADNIEKNISKLYENLKPLFKRLSELNQTIAYPLVFSYKQELLYKIYVDVDKALDSYNYFSTQYKRQVIASTLDSSWRKFVTKLTSNLDADEIKSLPKDFEKMEKENLVIALDTFANSIIPTTILDTPSKSTKSPGSTINTESVDNSKSVTHLQISPDAPCPCGSNKKFAECHGRNIGSRHPARRIR